MTWQPIETAPKDGTVVLLFGKFYGEISGECPAPLIDIGHWSDGTSDAPGNDWWVCSGGDYYACWIRATHWMPLPEPPK